MIEEGVTIFAASPATEETTEAAKRYIKKHGLTSDDVSLRTKHDKSSVIVVTKRVIDLKPDEGEEVYE